MVALGDHPPVAGTPGALWFCSADGQLYVSYQDINSVQWVPASNAAFGVPATNAIAPGSGDTVVLTDIRRVYVDNSAPLAALTILLPAAASDTVIEIGFRLPVAALTLKSAAGMAIPGAPDSGFGPGAAIQMKFLTSGWVYWK